MGIQCQKEYQARREIQKYANICPPGANRVLRDPTETEKKEYMGIVHHYGVGGLRLSSPPIGKESKLAKWEKGFASALRNSTMKSLWGKYGLLWCGYYEPDQCLMSWPQPSDYTKNNIVKQKLLSQRKRKFDETEIIWKQTRWKAVFLGDEVTGPISVGIQKFL